MAKFIEINSRYINTDNINYFDAKIIVKNRNRHEITQEDLNSFKQKDGFEIQGYVVHIYFLGDDENLKFEFSNKSEITHFISKLIS